MHHSHHLSDLWKHCSMGVCYYHFQVIHHIVDVLHCLKSSPFKDPIYLREQKKVGWAKVRQIEGLWKNRN
jgi:hypothetical protein